MKIKKSSMEQAEAAVQQQGGAYISARLRNPGDISAKSKGGEPADKVGFICAILATLILVAITAMLYLNWDLIKTA